MNEQQKDFNQGAVSLLDATDTVADASSGRRTAACVSPVSNQGQIRVPARRNLRLQQIIRQVNHHPEVWALWRCANVNAMDRLGMSDHGWVHAQIVANIGLRLLRLLQEAGVTPSSVAHHGLDPDDAEVIVVLGALLHDVGIGIHREEHEHFSLVSAGPVLKEILYPVYLDPTKRTIIWSEVMHAIISHNRDVQSLSLEAGIVKVADALDMTKGRYRVPFAAGKLDIHSVSTTAVETVTLRRGEVKAVHVSIGLCNSAGLFQIDELLRRKLKTSGLAPYLDVTASIDGETEKRLVPTYAL